MGVGEDGLSGSQSKPDSIYFFFFSLELVHQDISSVTLGHRCWAQESVQSHSQSEPFTRLVVGLVCVLAIFEASKYE